MIDSMSSSEGANRDKAAPRGNANRAKAGSRRGKRSGAKVKQFRTEFSSERDVRAEMVDWGKKLAADPNYPSEDVIRKVAALIVNSPQLSEDPKSDR
jgi:hypothetical protein